MGMRVPQVGVNGSGGCEYAVGSESGAGKKPVGAGLFFKCFVLACPCVGVPGEANVLFHGQILFSIL